MFKGFYNLTSGMLSQGRRLDVIASNMTNISTAGYKLDHYTDSTFRDVVISRVGNQDKLGAQALGSQSYILAPSQLYTDYTQGGLEETGLPLDFAIEGEGFFAISRDGQVGYTRAGSFSLDDEGYLCLPGQGRVLDQDGNPIRLETDRVEADETGALYSERGNYLGRLGVYAFPDNAALERNDRGLFVGNGAQAAQGAALHHGMVERSNVNMVQEMVNMMTAQRALQSAAQMSKIYDQVITKATNDLGRL
jgi:flagellar basal-body rod protein FlgF